MIERMFMRIVLGSLMIAAYLCCSNVYSQEAVGEPNAVIEADVPREPNRAEIGKENPFTNVPEENKSNASQQTNYTAPSGKENKPDLFVETVSLKSLSAQSLRSAIGNMSSEHGSIAVDTKSNSLIICDTKENLKKIIAQIQRAEQSAAVKPQQPDAQKNNGDADAKPQLTVETVSLKFLDAKNLKAAIDGLVSADGKISINEKNNSLIICDNAENLAKILVEIRRADRTPQQIMIEVVIVDVKLKNDTEIGINWDILSGKNYDMDYRQNFTESRLGATKAAIDNATTGNFTAFNTTGTGGDFSVISGTIRNVIHLLQQKRDAEILASPRVMVVSGQSAYIEAIEELPYTEVTDTAGGGASALTSTRFKNVGVKLGVSATLTDGNDILLTVEAEQNVQTASTSTSTTTGVPVVDTRKAKTSLLLADGKVIILGGLRRQEKTKQVYQIPIISSLPVIGELFKSTKTVLNNSELVVFLSPHIYKGEATPDDAMKKYDEISNRPLLLLPNGKAKQTNGNANGELKTILSSLEKSLSR